MISNGNNTYMDFQPNKVEIFKTIFTLNFSPRISYLSAVRLFEGNGGSIEQILKPHFCIWKFAKYDWPNHKIIT